MLAALASHHRLWSYLGQAAASFATLALVIAVFVPLEHFFAVRKERLFYPGWATNLGWYFVNAVSATVLLGPPALLIAWLIQMIVPAALAAGCRGVAALAADDPGAGGR